MIKIRTDLAVEAREIIEESGNSSEIPGVKTVNKQLDDCVVTKVDVLDEQGSQIMNKGIGTYVTLESKLMKYDDDESREQMIKYLVDELKEIFGPDEHKKTLVIGLGNWNITSDALGPRTVSKTLSSRFSGFIYFTSFLDWRSALSHCLQRLEKPSFALVLRTK